MIALAAAGPSPFWFVTRGTGAVSLVLLTVTVALGIANVRRTQLADLPRFVTDAVHRSASLLAVTFLLVHIATALLDGFAPITLLDTVIPFGSAYRPVWLGLGAVALDLILAVTITSLLRRRLGYGAWRFTHWLAYASWPVALLHGLGTGTDTKTHWMLLLSAACTIVVVLAVLARVSAGWPGRLGLRLGALAAAGAIPLGILVWLPAGPLGPHWAQRAGTPATLLHAARASSVTYASVSREGTGGEQGEHEHSFRSPVTGDVRRSPLSGGQQLVDISLRAPGEVLSRLDIQIQGPAAPGGGVEMNTSRVTLGPASDPSQYGGQVTALDGSSIVARVDNPGHAALTLLTRLQLSRAGALATGTLDATATEGTH
ncbi:MAG TPA: ferric reductase-like transmembrane domain-containing protein [Solirubrobacteraceae bacterium]